MTPLARDPDFVLEHSGFVRALARELVFDEELARDVEQETWLAALSNTPSGGSPRAWLATLVRNIAFKAWRGKLRRSDRELAVAREPRAVPTPAELLDRENSRREIVEAVVALDEPWRSALIARYFEELSPEQAAQRLGVPLETLRTRLKRGRELLRERLARRHGKFGSAAALALVRAWQLEPPSYLEVGAAAARSLIQGALVVTATQKAALAVAAAVLFCAAFWVWRNASAVRTGTAPIGREVAELTPVAPVDEYGERSHAERVETQAAVDATIAATPPADPTRGSLLLRAIWGDDKTAASGVWLRLLQEHADDYYHDLIEVQTGADGTILIEGLLAGSVRIRADRGSADNAQVVAGAQSESTVFLWPCRDIAGTVLDVDGSPYAGAEIYLQVWGASHEGFVVARSESDGSFVVRGTRSDSASYLSARAHDRAPTKQTMLLRGVDSAGAKLTLQFESVGGALAGRVFDADGHPIAEASVLLGPTGVGFVRSTLADGSDGKPPAAQRVRTNQHGEYRFDGAAPGAEVIRVRAKRLAPWSGVIDIAEQRESHLDIHMTRGADLEGVVRTSDGVPAGGVEVWANASDGFAAVMTRTRPDGSFELHQLPLAEFEVEVESDFEGRAQTTLVGLEGVVLRWDPVLSRELVLRGRVVAPGKELFGWSVIAEPMQTGLEWVDRVDTDDQGRFEIANCPDVPLRVRLRAPLLGWLDAAIAENIRADAGELTLEPDPALEPSVRLSGRVVDAIGRPIGGAAIVPCNPKVASRPLRVADEAGRFDIGPLPAGDWTLRVIAPGLCSVSKTQPSRAGESWDFGDVVAERGGGVLVELSGDCGSPEAPTIVRLRDATGWTERIPVEGHQARSVLVLAGRHQLSVERAGCAAHEREIEVVAGADTRVTVELSSN